MKTSNYLWAALATATLSLSACSSDENENGMQPKEKTAKQAITHSKEWEEIPKEHTTLCMP